MTQHLFWISYLAFLSIFFLKNKTYSDFIIQFGIAAEPNESQKWDTTIPDDPMLVQPNIRGTISYATAGPNTRTTQLFINTQNNQEYLDRMGFTPIGMIVPTTDGDQDAMDTIIPYIAKPKTKKDEDGIDQDHYMKYGNPWLFQHYPEVDVIINTTLITAVTEDDDDDNHGPEDHMDAIGRISPNENDGTGELRQSQTHRFQNRQYNDNDNHL